jgi:predicted alpha/beta superfamily hydrolase
MRKIYLILSLTLLICQSSIADTEKESIIIGEKLSMQSKVLDEERKYWVHLPNNYNENKRYPVVYLLDGNGHFEQTVGILKHMSGSGLMPEMLLVAILNTDRTRDLTPTHTTLGSDGKSDDFLKNSGGSKTFLKFIKTELMPKIENDYATAPHKVLIGHSFGGLFSLFALLEEPDLFQSYVSIDPSIWWDNQWLNTQLAIRLDTPPKNYTSLFIAAANNPDRKGAPPQLMMRPQRNFFAKVSTWNSNTFSSEIEYFPNEDHGSVPLIALYKALKFIYQDFNINIETVIEDPSLLSRHFESWSKKLGYAFPPPENTINYLGYAFMGQGKIEQAIEFFKKNVEMYPYSSNTYDSLAEGYMEKGETKLAIKYYQKVISMDGKSDRVETIIEELKEKLK